MSEPRKHVPKAPKSPRTAKTKKSCEVVRDDDALERAIRRRLPHVACSPYEVFVMAAMDDKGCLKEVLPLFDGGVGHVVIDPKRVAETAQRVGAKRVAFAHNHPSGSTAPSYEDEYVTDRLTQRLAAVGIDVDRHMILTREARGVCQVANWSTRRKPAKRAT